MPTVILIGHNFVYPIIDVLRMFYGSCSCSGENQISAGLDTDIEIYSQLSGECVTTWVEGSKERLPVSDLSEKLAPKREVKRQLYILLSGLLGRVYPWGSLTGIRPTVIAREAKTAKELTDIYFVREDKALLAIETAKNEDRILNSVTPDVLCAYMGVPFCRSRCTYCSFISQDAAAQTHLLVPYTEAIQKEIDSFFQENAPKISCLYVGGGTPTVFDDNTFRSFLENSFRSLGTDSISEITVEAGRADTITDHKLHTLKDLGVQRICINPQTLSDRTLVRIGRDHTTGDFYTAYNAARKIGFKTVSVDLIAGLPGESPDDFIHSLEGVFVLDPENITIHTLSIKKKASISMDVYKSEDRKQVEELDRMLSYAHARLKEKGYLPYYLYRQKDTLGGHENTGYSRPGHECIYNVAMMSDQRSILAFGAGSVSKRSFADERLQRCPNVRDAKEYIRRSEEMALRKRCFFGV